MQNRGQIFAYDSDKARLAPIFDRIRALQKSATCRFCRSRSELAPLAGQMDLVLIDAPCTGTGTWRRRPDAKWRLTQRQLDVRIGEQAAILDAASAYVKPGGRLVYVTCSVFAAENGEQIDAFLKRSPDFAPLDHAMLWKEHFPEHMDAARIDGGRGISLTPACSGTDGFFFSVLSRVS